MKIFVFVILLSNIVYSQKDTVYVLGYYETRGTYGTLNDSIDIAINNGTINNTVFKLKSNDKYVLTKSIFLDHGQNLEIVAPKPLKIGDQNTIQNSAPPQILWTEKDIDRNYIIQTCGDIVMKNIWVRFADILGNKVSSSIVFENQTDANDPEKGVFDGCIFDYAGVGAESGGAITVKTDHFDGNFQNCYWRNNTDSHFRYYGRAVSFPYESSGWHYDRLLFENCTFTNLSRIVMMEGNEYGSNIHLNHCTVLNNLEWVVQSGWLENLSITNSLFVNSSIIGYRAVDVCEYNQDYNDFKNDLCAPPTGALFQDITPVDSFNFEVNFTDLDRKIFIGNNNYIYQDWMLDWYKECNRCENRDLDLLYNPLPYIGEAAIAFIDSTGPAGKKVFTKMNIDTKTMFFVDPEFIEPATNQDSLLFFVECKWCGGCDMEWGYKPKAGFNQTWLLPENLAYNNTELQTAAMEGFPLGDLNWYPEQLSEWEEQRDEEWQVINNWLNYGTPNPTSVTENWEFSLEDYSLEQNYPNPFNPVTIIKYSLPKRSFTKIHIYDSMGRKISVLVNEIKEAGNYNIKFSAANLSSGIYFYRISSDNYSETKKMLFLK